MSTVLDALIQIQADLKAPKDQKTSRYRYRNIEDINEAVKPLAAAHGCAVVYSDEYRDGICVSTCHLLSADQSLCATGFALVDKAPKHMSIEQACGSASSYARKYAACGLFAIDSSELDPDKARGEVKKWDEHNEKRDNAKRRLWQELNRYAERFNKDPNDLLAKAKARGDWEDTITHYAKLTEEFETDAFREDK